jgi:heme-degrading monooxygenase HmoA
MHQHLHQLRYLEQMSSAGNAIAQTPRAPYYAVIFTSQRTEGNRGYGHMADRMAQLARQQPGFLGVESVRGADGFGITVSYWESEDTIQCWKAHSEHKLAKEFGTQTIFSESPRSNELTAKL